MCHCITVHRCAPAGPAPQVSNFTGRPPVFVHSVRTQDLGKGLAKVKGISSHNQHSAVSELPRPLTPPLLHVLAWRAWRGMARRGS